MQNHDSQEQLDDICHRLDKVLGNDSTTAQSPNKTFRLKAISQSLNIIAKNLHDVTLIPDSNETLHELPDKLPEESPVTKLYKYILLHLDEPLPSAKKLARLLHTNQRKLKEGFREQYNTSIYSFFNEQRLEKARNLIMNSHKSIKEIASDCGFNTYHAFYSAFSKQFGYAPTDLRTSKK
jgi:AraC-like DNA-binding protein